MLESVKCCPCHSGFLYKDCCQLYHRKKKVPTPQALMRSRYSAYALGLVEYIIATTDPCGPLFQKQRQTWLKSLQDFSRQTVFIGLELHNESIIGLEAWVGFHAKLQNQQGKDISFTEESCFIFRSGRWFYHSGKILQSRSIGQNPIG